MKTSVLMIAGDVKDHELARLSAKIIREHQSDEKSQVIVHSYALFDSRKIGRLFVSTSTFGVFFLTDFTNCTTVMTIQAENINLDRISALLVEMNYEVQYQEHYGA
jgi:hypothetical protein